MKKILILLVLAAVFVLAPQETFAQRKSKSNQGPTLRPSKQQNKVKKKIAKRKKKSASLQRSSENHAFYWRKENELAA